MASEMWKSVPMPHDFFGAGLDTAMCGGIEVLENYAVDSKGLPKNILNIRKRKSSDAVSVTTKKQKNSFEVSDIKSPGSKENTEHKKNLAQSADKRIDKKKKSKKKSTKNKPALNVEAFNKVSGITKNEINEVEKSVPDKSVASKAETSSSVAEKRKAEAKVKSGSVDMSAWREYFVCEEIIEALAEKGFDAPTPIQSLTLPAALKGKMDIVGAAETGSGKTLAFGIPIVQGILGDIKKEKEQENDGGNDDELTEDNEDQEKSENKTNDGKLRALVLTPTRELAVQIKNHLQDIVAKTDISVTVIVGGISSEKQLRLLNRRPEIIVATPGRLWELVQEGVPHLSNLSQIRYLAIDETDRMGEKGHFDELQKLLEMMRAEGTGTRQNFVMSATLSFVHKPPTYNKGKRKKQKSPKEKMQELMEFVGVSERRKVVDITRKAGTAETLTESLIHCSLEEKDCYLYYFIKTHKGRTVVFCNSIDCVRRLGNLFSYLDTKPLPLHAQLHQKQRLKNLERFTSSTDGLLIATDVAARGLDIPDIQHVIHYQVPRTSESYIHRSGRTARASKSGLSVLLVDPSETNLYKKLCLTLSRTADLPRFPVDGPRFAQITSRMEAARTLDVLMLQTRKKSLGKQWFQKAAEEADLILSDDEDSDCDKGQESSLNKQKIDNAKRELTFLLKTPLVVSEFTGKYPTQSGCLPLNLYNPKEQTAVDALQSDVANSENILKKKTCKTNKNDRLFKGFKKRKKNLKPS